MGSRACVEGHFPSCGRRKEENRANMGRWQLGGEKIRAASPWRTVTSEMHGESQQLRERRNHTAKCRVLETNAHRNPLPTVQNTSIAELPLPKHPLFGWHSAVYLPHLIKPCPIKGEVLSSVYTDVEIKSQRA